MPVPDINFDDSNSPPYWFIDGVVKFLEQLLEIKNGRLLPHRG